MCGDVYTTTINFNGKNVYSSRYSTCCCNMYSYNSCFNFGFGYNRFNCFPGNFMRGLGFGIGFGTAMLLPSLIANLCSKSA